jgi:hypothetical protein
MGQRRDFLDKRIANQIKTRRIKSRVKDAERDRREIAMLKILKEGELPYTPGVMSWLSVKLGKKASKITRNDVTALVK